MYAYAGFPRSLNGINNLLAVLKDRESKGIKDEVGRESQLRHLINVLRTKVGSVEANTADLMENWLKDKKLN